MWCFPKKGTVLWNCKIPIISTFPKKYKKNSPHRIGGGCGVSNPDPLNKLDRESWGLNKLVNGIMIA